MKIIAAVVGVFAIVAVFAVFKAWLVMLVLGGLASTLSLPFLAIGFFPSLLLTWLAGLLFFNGTTQASTKS
jgi:hypothetical protein